MGNAAQPVWERVIQAKGRLLRVAREPAPGGGAQLARGYVLVFDVGSFALRSEAGALVAEPLAPGVVRGVAADEDEPWWALLGQRPTKLQAREGGELLVQFREDGESPRLLLFAPRGSAVSVRTVV